MEKGFTLTDAGVLKTVAVRLTGYSKIVGYIHPLEA